MNSNLGGTARHYFLLLPGLIGAGILSGCGEKSPEEKTRPNVLLVTFDTTRVDYFSCYGHPGNTTPTVDAIAREGIRFTNGYAPAPITLPSHASMMTGLYPFQHKIRNNGAGVLDDKAVTLAELFRDSGYRTGAFIGAYVLHSRYGIHQGFEKYSDEFEGSGAHMEDGTLFAERRADAVTDDALGWLEQKDDRPVFLWVHYFDPHAPYEAPNSRPGAPVPDAYADEIRFADQQLARLIRKFDERTQNQKRQSWTIIASDHGEGLGEHGEDTHAFFLYNTTVHVALVVKGPGVAWGQVSQTPVSLTDIYPSIVEWLGFKMPYEVGGKPLPLQPTQGGESRALVFETVAPYQLYGWSPLEAIIVGGRKYVVAPRPELYDLAADPKEEKNLAELEKDRVAEMAAMLASALQSGPGVPSLSVGARETDSASLQKLRSLGYISGSSDVPSELAGLPDPKDVIALVGVLKNAEGLLSALNPEGATPLAEVLNRDPNNVRALDALELYLRRPQLRKSLIPIAQARLQKPLPTPYDVEIPATLGLALCQENQLLEGFSWVDKAAAIDARSFRTLAGRSGCLEQSERFEEALAIWSAALQENPADAAALDAMGDMYSRRRSFSQAADYYSRAAAIDKDNAEILANLANALVNLNRIDEAVAAFRRALQLAPQVTPMRARLASLLMQHGKIDEAIAELKKVVVAAPDNPAAHYDLAVALLRANHADAAVGEFHETLRIDPDHGDALINLGIALLGLGNTQEGKEALTRATRIERVQGAAYFHLAMAVERSGNAEMAMNHLRQAAEARPLYLPAIEEYARRCVRDGKYADARRALEGGVAVAPDNLKIVNSLAMLLATCPDDSVRDGAKAVQLATAANERTNFAQPALLSTLAAAQAESGNFPAAIETVNSALAIIGEQQTPIRGMLNKQLEDFRAGRPYRSKQNR